MLKLDSVRLKIRPLNFACANKINAASLKKSLIITLAILATSLWLSSSLAAQKKADSKTTSSASSQNQTQLNKASKNKKLSAKTSKFKLIRGSEFELCQEIKNILNEPENKNFLEPNPNKDENYEYPRRKYIFSNAGFAIPKRYKKFNLPVWEDVPIEDASKYMKPGERLSGIIEFNQRYKAESIQIEMKKTKLALTSDGKEQIILRFKPNDFQKRWFCYVSDIEPNIVADDYNRSDFGECFFFSHEGKVFRAKSHLSELFIDEPGMVRIEVFAVSPLCYFRPK
jgi:hypothetical protein